MVHELLAEMISQCANGVILALYGSSNNGPKKPAGVVLNYRRKIHRWFAKSCAMTRANTQKVC